MQLDSKLPHVGTTIFSIMSRMAAESNAINLSQGFPDFNAPRELLDAVTEAMLSGQNQYAPQNGVEELRVAIAKKSEAIYGANLDKDQEITVSSGASEAIFNAVTAVIHPGDEAILFDPAYDCYEPAIRLAGGVAKRIPLKFPSYDYDWDQVRDTLSPKTRLIMINSPHNPTGKILRDQDIEALTTIVRDHDCVLISDEVYEHIVFDGEPHRSFLKYPELRERSFVISSFGKTY
ncbi:MAG: aminotransferase class I/II-fold pyridoxal phosphate-dependent enzyme, partial [Candidatus Eisenbacteria bacterium]|nr:aminotransferase class I/II-fold pyridoxal phosphate-dependent enzyme [Candidatus Eisenbacteria bacterium]